jgi:hypothetical protein
MASRLLELKTDLRSLRFGFDRPQGDSSNEPAVPFNLNPDFNNSNPLTGIGGALNFLNSPVGQIAGVAGNLLVGRGVIVPSKISQQVVSSLRLTQSLMGNAFNITGGGGGFDFNSISSTINLLQSAGGNASSETSLFSEAPDNFFGTLGKRLGLINDPKVHFKLFTLTDIYGITGAKDNTSPSSDTPGLLERVFNGKFSQPGEIAPAFNNRILSKGKPGTPRQDNVRKITSFSPDYTRQGRHTGKYGIDGRYGKRTDRGDYAFNSSAEAIDRINAMLPYDDESFKEIANQTQGFKDNEAIDDMIDFRIKVLNNDKQNVHKIIRFRAFLEGFQDSYTANYNEQKYVGRGDTFYNYTGFMREIGFGFKVVALSQAELIPMYKKLNYLASVIMPDYNNSGFMRGNMVRLTVGDYIKDLPGFIGGFTYAFNDAAPFEIGIDGRGERNRDIPQVPHMIDVQSFTFKPVHDFVARRNAGVSGDSIKRYISLTDKAYSATPNIKALSAVSPSENQTSNNDETSTTEVQSSDQQLNQAAESFTDGGTDNTQIPESSPSTTDSAPFIPPSQR